MTATQRAQPLITASGSFGGYVRDGAGHTVVAVRDRGRPWRLVDVTGETATVIESTRFNIVDTTRELRREHGEVWPFDPQAIVGAPAD
jgi:hypothetical protein